MLTMDYSYPGWSACEARDRCRLSDLTAAVMAGQLVTAGHSEVAIPEIFAVPRNRKVWTELTLDETSETIRHSCGKLITDVRYYPVMHAPNVTGILGGLSLSEAFRLAVLEDPEVLHSSQSFSETCEVFRDGMAPGAFITYEWELFWRAEDMAFNWERLPITYADSPPHVPRPEVTAAANVLSDRFECLRRLLAAGRLKATGTFATTGFYTSINRVQWSRPDQAIEVRRSDLCEKVGNTINWRPVWTGIALEPDADADAAFVNWLAAGTRTGASVSSRKIEAECIAWLKDVMIASPRLRLKTKNDWHAEAKGKWPHVITKRLFERLWTQAIDETGALAWQASGRPRKSSQSEIIPQR